MFIDEEDLNLYHQLQMKKNAIEIILCYKRAHHLVIEHDHKTANKNKFVWPSI